MPETPGTIDVLATGPQVLLQDAGRPGYAALGVGSSGPADRGAHDLANRLVGNPSTAATLEVLLGGLVIRARSPLIVALTGALAVPTLNGSTGAYSVPLVLKAGDELTLDPPETGLRTYVSVAGGWDVPPVLGSRSTDTLSGLGPPPVTAGMVVRVGPRHPGPAAATAEGARIPTAGTLELEVLAGPRRLWLSDPRALSGPWTVSARSDRIGVRLEGTPLTRTAETSGLELPSEGAMRGSIQLPPSGLPVIFGPDHPVTGGYPVVGVLSESASDLLAQARPGQSVILRDHPEAEGTPDRGVLPRGVEKHRSGVRYGEPIQHL